jgi:hypothetical protein
VTLVAGAKLGAEVVVAGGVLRLMMLKLDTWVADGACTFTPTKEDVGLTDDPGEELNASAGLMAGVVEHASPVTVTVAVEINRTVSTPSGPLELKMDRPFDTPELGVIVDAGAEDDDEVMIPPKPKLCEELAVGVPGEDKGVKEAALEGTIPPKPNVPAGGEELNWRLFSLMTDGEGAGALRLMMEGLLETCGAAA